MSETEETRAFEAEVSQLLRLMIHSMYSHREVFLRELISNASDAIDKLRFEALSDESLFEGQTELKIEVEIDEDERTITVRDTGIGMSREEIVSNIGTIAHSGTRQFLEALTGDQKKDAALIGQFGVGFYSAFIVAERVVLTTRRAGVEEAVRWESRGEGEYTLSTAEKETRGTEIVLHLRDDGDEFLQPHRLEEIARRYSDHISFPIHFGEHDEESGETTWRKVNQAAALWTRPESEITEEEYQGFYKHVARAFDEPLTWVHSTVEGLLRFTLLLYVPTEKPFELKVPGQETTGGVKLYVKRVFILDDAEMFLPRYLRFIRGVVDSDDLPLNVSRELLQDHRVVDTIRKSATKRVLRMLEELSEDAEKYATFWEAFGPILKEGIVEDPSRQEEVASLLRFASTAQDDGAETVTLKEYRDRMKPGQEAIYFVTADSYEAALASPHLEIFLDRGVEVLVLTDPVDEWVAAHLAEFDGVKVRSVDRGALDLESLGEEGAEGDAEGDEADDEEKADEPEVPEEWAGLLSQVQQSLEGRVAAVRLSKRLKESPACLVRQEWEMGARMRRILSRAGEEVPAGTPTLELNPDHPLVVRLQGVDDPEALKEWSELFFEQAQLSEGGALQAPAVFVRRLNRLMQELTKSS